MYRHFTLPAYHARIPQVTAEGLAKIAAASTDQLQEAVAHCDRILILADEQWAAYYAIKDELIERGAWNG